MKLMETKNIIKDEIQKSEYQFKMFTRMRRALEAFEGKKITKRVMYGAEMEFPDYQINYESTATNYYLTMRPKKVDYADAQRQGSYFIFTVGGGFQDEPFSLEDFDRRNTCYSCQKEVADQNKAFLESGHFRRLTALMNRFNGVVEDLQEIEDLYPNLCINTVLKGNLTKNYSLIYSFDK